MNKRNLATSLVVFTVILIIFLTIKTLTANRYSSTGLTNELPNLDKTLASLKSLNEWVSQLANYSATAKTQTDNEDKNTLTNKNSITQQNRPQNSDAQRGLIEQLSSDSDVNINKDLLTRLLEMKWEQFALNAKRFFMHQIDLSNPADISKMFKEVDVPLLVKGIDLMLEVSNSADIPPTSFPLFMSLYQSGSNVLTSSQIQEIVNTTRQAIFDYRNRYKWQDNGRLNPESFVFYYDLNISHIERLEKIGLNVSALKESWTKPRLKEVSIEKLRFELDKFIKTELQFDTNQSELSKPIIESFINDIQNCVSARNELQLKIKFIKSLEKSEYLTPAQKNQLYKTILMDQFRIYTQ
ncbi:MAG: hypothetical protein HY606_12270 [Planctomycetes bacterium]|nr:hypothetical protein [Planctomycetota bacterium]